MKQVPITILFSLGLGLLFAGCAEPRTPMHAVDLQAQSERIKNSPPFMQGSELFFDGQVKVVASLMTGGRGPVGPDGKDSGKREGGGRRGGFGGGGGPGGHMGGGPGGGMGGGEMGEPSAMPARRISESHMPAVYIRLKFENLGKETLKLSVWEMKSELGGFAVRPNPINLAPGQSLDSDIMTSRLGLTSGEIAMALDLRLGARKDLKQIILTQVQTKTD
jgi:hypothetical protein